MNGVRKLNLETLFRYVRRASVADCGETGGCVLIYISQNIGTLWFGIGRPEVPSFGDLDFVIMIAISRVDNEKKFRKDMLKSKRKPIEEIWVGNEIPGVTDIIRFAPSSCNTQPWIVEHQNNILQVFMFFGAVS